MSAATLERDVQSRIEHHKTTAAKLKKEAAKNERLANYLSGLLDGKPMDDMGVIALESNQDIEPIREPDYTRDESDVELGAADASGMTVNDAILYVLAEAGKPLTTPQIRKALEQAGADAAQSSIYSAISTMTKSGLLDSHAHSGRGKKYTVAAKRSAKSQTGQRKRGPKPGQQTIESAIITALKRSKPLTTSEIVEKLDSMGVECSDNSVASRVSTMVREGTLKRVSREGRGFMYQLKG